MEDEVASPAPSIAISRWQPEAAPNHLRMKKRLGSAKGFPASSTWKGLRWALVVGRAVINTLETRPYPGGICKTTNACT